MTANRGQPRYQDYLFSFKKALDVDGTGLCVLFGPSEYLLSRSAEALRKSWNDGGFQIDASDAKDLGEGGFYALFEQASLFAPKTGAVLRRCEQQPSLPKWLKNLKKVDRPVALVFTKDRVPAAFTKDLDRLGALRVPCVEPVSREFPQLIRAMGRKKGLGLSQDALALITESLGEDLIKIDHELEKLSMIFAGEDPKAAKELSADDIAPYLGVLRQDHAFALDRMLLEHRFAQAHVLTMDLITRGEEPLKLVGLLSRHCRQALKISAEKAKGRPAHELGRAVGLPSWVAKSYTSYVAKTPQSRLLRALERCREADRLMKSSPVSADLAIGRIVEALAGA